ncbi:MAG: hypothetical protein EOO43_02970 [Flavobacterium sp.]|nr:MAG: hypothetical protein EOO43_02970 [Flavobacterium sp.]
MRRYLLDENTFSISERKWYFLPRRRYSRKYNFKKQKARSGRN